MVERPTGTVTFLFTDVEGSTRLWEDHPSQMEIALELHDRLLRQAIERSGGYVFTTAGDAFSAAFDRAADALAAAQAAQEALRAAQWPPEAPIRVRIGVHTGEAQERDGDYFGPALNRAARIMSAGHGGQILISAVAAGLLEAENLVDVGEHRLKDLSAREHLFQFGVESFPALRSLEVVRHNLPVERTPLVGRKDDIGQISGLVSDHRLVTLLGIGGTGKTRLATAVAAELADQFVDGVWFVDLVPAGGAEQVVEAIATAAGLSVSGTDLVEALAELISDRDMLLVLDNCEHITDDVADVVDILLEATTGPKLLATSREPLQLVDERHVHVPPLDVDVDLASPAVELFIATAARVGAPVEPDRLDTVSRICTQLDGLPLAIELAASQLRQYTVAELADRLDQRFELLTQGRRGRSRRQASLIAVLEDTWGTLDLHQRELLMLLAAFPSSFAATDVEAASRTLEVGSVGHTLAGLVDRSLVARDGDGRHRLLETVKLFAQQHWLSGDPDRFLETHTQWVIRHICSHTREEWYTSASLAAWANRHYDDHRLVETRLAEAGRVDELTDLIGGLTGYAAWTTGGRASTTIDRIDQYLGQLPLSASQTGVLNLAAGAAGLSCRRQEWIERGSRKAADIFGGGSRPEELAWAQIMSSWMIAFRDHDRALALLDEGHDLAEASGAESIADLARLYRAVFLALVGQVEAALEIISQVEGRIEARPYDRSRQEFQTLKAALLLTTEPVVANQVAMQHHRESEEVFGSLTALGWWSSLQTAESAAATGDVRTTLDRLALTERTLRDDAADNGLPDLLLAPAMLAWALERHDLCRRWLTAIRRAPEPTQNFLSTIVYRQLRGQVGLLDHNPLDHSSIEEIYEEAKDWLADL